MDNDGIDQYPIDTMEYGCVWTMVWISQPFPFDDDDDMLERVAFSSPKSGTGQWKIGDRWIPGFREFWLKPSTCDISQIPWFQHVEKPRKKRWNLMIPKKPIQWVEKHEDSDNEVSCIFPKWCPSMFFWSQVLNSSLETSQFPCSTSNPQAWEYGGFCKWGYP